MLIFLNQAQISPFSPRGRRWREATDEGGAIRFDSLSQPLTPGIAEPSPSREEGNNF